MKIVCKNLFSAIKNKGYYRVIPALFLLIIVTVISGREGWVMAYTGGKAFTRCDSTGSLKTFIITGKVTQTYSYCGGAAPPKQILDQLAIPVPYAGKKFYIRTGKINSIKGRIVQHFITGKEGEFSIRLSPGIYCVILEEQVRKISAGDYIKKDQRADDKCLQEWWKKPYYLLEVKDKNINELNFNFHHRCFISSDIPCLEYTGSSVP